MAQDLLQKALIAAKDLEVSHLHPKAALSKEHSRLITEQEDFRPPYKRDVDRILNSKAYARYVDKTQVVYLVDNDHLTHRSLHVQLVSNFSRGIGRLLCLNEDLIEAIALGHDVGHAPFGHEGETYLSELFQQHGNKTFSHPLQSCRLLSQIEELNLDLAVLDGFLCHDGGLKTPSLTPAFGKTWEDHFKERLQKLENPEVNLIPGTLEGCLVKLCDTMSYIGKDLEDGVRMGLVSWNDLPQTCLGTGTGSLLKTFAQDLVSQSYLKDKIQISSDVFEAMKTLRDFNFKQIYFHPKLKTASQRIKLSFKILFNCLLEDYNDNSEKSHLWCYFLHNKPPAYLKQTDLVQKGVDYIAGMTDHYFIRTLEKMVVPSKLSAFELFSEINHDRTTDRHLH